jgi:hypothetical protein
LKEGSVSNLRDNFVLGVGECRVVGRIGASWISLEARRGATRNSFRPVLRGQLEPDAAGCRLVGTFGWAPVVKAFVALWLGVGCCIFLGLFVHAVLLAIGGDDAGLDFLICLIPLGYVLAGVAITARGTHVDRTEAWYFQSWLADRLQASVGLPTYPPSPEETPQ